MAKGLALGALLVQGQDALPMRKGLRLLHRELLVAALPQDQGLVALHLGGPHLHVQAPAAVLAGAQERVGHGLALGGADLDRYAGPSCSRPHVHREPSDVMIEE